MITLVVDPDPLLAKYMKEFLIFGGHQSLALNIAADADFVLKRIPFDVVAINLTILENLPVELTCYSQSMRSRFLVLSADKDAEHRLRKLSLSPEDLMRHPISFQKFLAKVEALGAPGKLKP
jgi:DNA-binding response OmpR family regulator